MIELSPKFFRILNSVIIVYHLNRAISFLVFHHVSLLVACMTSQQPPHLRFFLFFFCSVCAHPNALTLTWTTPHVLIYGVGGTRGTHPTISHIHYGFICVRRVWFKAWLLFFKDALHESFCLAHDCIVHISKEWNIHIRVSPTQFLKAHNKTIPHKRMIQEGLINETSRILHKLHSHSHPSSLWFYIPHRSLKVHVFSQIL